MILAFDDHISVNPPEIREVFSVWPVAVIVLISLLIIGAYYLGRRHRGMNRPEPWSRVEILTAIGVAVMIGTFVVTLLNVEVRKWLGLP
jgi:uncharacterized membrane protein YidH (DUF202 family)